MKKKLALLLSLGLCVSTMTITASADEEKTYKIGVCQLMEHDALDAAYNGFVEGLKEAGYEEGKNLEIDMNNAQGDQSNCATIAAKLKNDGCDLVFAIATPAAQACANEITDTPILISAVTDPAASGLVRPIPNFRRIWLLKQERSLVTRWRLIRFLRALKFSR